MIKVVKDVVVTMRYVMKNSHGEVLEDRMQGSPIHYLHGSPDIFVSLQQQLEGLRAGDQKIVQLPKGLGDSDDDYTFFVVIDMLRSSTEEERVLGYPIMPGEDVCDKDCDCHLKK